MKVGIRKQQGREGATPKTICPLCGKEYLKSAGGNNKGLWKRVGLYCPNTECNYIVKDN